MQLNGEKSYFIVFSSDSDLQEQGYLHYHAYILPFTRLMKAFLWKSLHHLPFPFTTHISSPLHPPSSSLLRHINLSLAAPHPPFSPSFSFLSFPNTSHYAHVYRQQACIFSSPLQKNPQTNEGHRQPFKGQHYRAKSPSEWSPWRER